MLSNIAFDIFSAGQETTSSTIAFTILYVLNNPNVQALIHDELTKQINCNKTIEMCDKQKLPYLNAVIKEGQRLSNLLAINLFHRNTVETTVNGMVIPKGTCILPQISSVLYDETVRV